VSLEGLPPDKESEVCFIGRSNVGKSSLINALFGRKNLARTSKTPGRTQELNYFFLGDKSFIVDLPGYGYARASKDKRSNWQDLIKLYISGRRSLKRVFTLVDSRHGLKSNDKEFFEFLDSCAVNYQIILTKTDKVKDKELTLLNEKLTEQIAQHPACNPEFLRTSANSKIGISDLRTLIGQIL
jgi:GTP-binding protein